MSTNQSIVKQTLDEYEAADYTGLSVSFFRRARSKAEQGNRADGPPFLKIGRAIRYRITDLDLWLESHKVA
jgi:predicted DNA-binding transcriptional regulator AlpA